MQDMRYNHTRGRVSIQLMSPASGNLKYLKKELTFFKKVSIQLMSPASGNEDKVAKAKEDAYEVSIQLMSPASGNVILPMLPNLTSWSFSFHSINVPSEWEHLFNRWMPRYDSMDGFHSINVPSEWELRLNAPIHANKPVSIQLMSPASGNLEP